MKQYLFSTRLSCAVCASVNMHESCVWAVGAETDRAEKCIKIRPGEENDHFWTGLCPTYKESVKTDVEKGKDVSTWRQGQGHGWKPSPEGLPRGVLELGVGVAVDRFIGWRVESWTLTKAESLHLPRSDVVLANEVTYRLGWASWRFRMVPEGMGERGITRTATK